MKLKMRQIRTILRVMTIVLSCIAIFTACSNLDNDATVTPPVEQQDKLVKLPAGVVIEDYTILKGEELATEDGTEIEVFGHTVQVAFDGKDIYISGLSYWFENSFVKGTLAADGTHYDIPSGQFVGKDEEGAEIYLNGFSESEDGVTANIRFDYDSATRTLKLSETNCIGECDAPNSMDCYAIIHFVKLTPGARQEPIAVTPPAGIEAQQWYLNASSYFVVKRTLSMVRDGQDVYLQGLFEKLPQAWVKGTFDGKKAVFPSNQFVGKIDDEEFYFQGMVEDEYGAAVEGDVVFDYDADKGMFTSECDILLTKGIIEVAVEDFFDVIISRQSDLVVAITPPQGLQTDEYYITALEYDEIEQTFDASYDNYLRIGFDGQDVYFQGLSDAVHDGWAKGTLSADGKTITIPANQYMGLYESDNSSQEHFITSVDSDGNMIDLTFNYDAEKGLLTTNQIVVINSNPIKFSPYTGCIFGKVTIGKKSDVAVTPKTPEINMQNTKFGYFQILLDIPLVAVDGTWLLADKTFYQLWFEKDGKQQPYTFTTSKYTDLSADMTEIPYTFTSKSFAKYGNVIYFTETKDEVGSWAKIGVQTIYSGGGAERKSEINWITPNLEIPEPHIFEGFKTLDII